MVDDDEILFRRVEFRGPGYAMAGELLRVSSQAFADTNMKPSVDRKGICHEATFTQGGLSNGVVRLTAGDVRGISDISQPPSSPSNTGDPYKFDVVPMPIESNPAHAEIHPAPAYHNPTRFKKLKERLARLAAWELFPADVPADVRV